MTATLFGRAHVFERGDHLYITTPVTLAQPSEAQIEEFAFASAVKQKAPNDNIGWLSGKYVEAQRPNLNGAMWLSEELALKSLTPMLMPVTVMHDPRTAVGTIADCKFMEEGGAARIDTILGIWRHRFPEIWEEAAADMESGQLMQSMETYAPWYTCSSCEQPFVKLPHGAEQASWCDHLRSNSSWRILRDVCFTGTGLIFGSRGGRGAYTEAYLDHFQDEIAEAHDQAHHDSTYRPSQRSASQMALVQIEESELAALRTERNDARGKVEEHANTIRDLTTKAETAEAAQKTAETERDAARAEVTDLTEKAEKAELKERRMGALGAGFLAKLGDTSKQVLPALAETASDEDWDTALKEREEMANAKRDLKLEAGASTDAGNGGGDPNAGGNAPAGSSFTNEEVASFMRSGVTEPAGTPAADGIGAVRSLGRSFNKRPAPAGAESK